MYVSIDALGVPSHVPVSEVIEALLERRYKVFRVLHPARYAHEAVGDANLQPDARGPEKVKAEGGGDWFAFIRRHDTPTSRSYSEQRERYIDKLVDVLVALLPSLHKETKQCRGHCHR